MNKYNGKQEDFSYIRDEGSRITVGYGLKEAENGLYEWYEVYFYKKQKNNLSLQDVKDAIIGDINARITNQIVGGFVWNDKSVWLSEENQMNFAQAVVPATFKIGEEADGTPVYHTFSTKTELKNFVEACVLWKQQCLTDGWQEKDAIDWTPYEALFPQEGESEENE